jgi:predicted extracellular nuclease
MLYLNNKIKKNCHMNIKQLLPLTLIFIFITFTVIAQQNQDYIYVASWNLENLFDTVDDPGTHDTEFTPGGEGNWTAERMEMKIENLAEVIRTFDQGDGFDILGVQEVEHRALLDSLLFYFPSRNFSIVYEESPDYRGIDNGLIYDEDKFDLLEKHTYVVELEGKYTTRLILHAKLRGEMGNLHVFVNHWPSRSGGMERTRSRRIAAATVLKNAIDKIRATEESPNIIALGDFNDEPENESIAGVLNASDFECNGSSDSNSKMYNLSFNLYEEGLGTYMYRGDWNMLDQIIVSDSMLDEKGIKYKCGSFSIVKPSIMVTKSGKYEGAAFPTYGGRTYLGGYSDHYPVGAKFLMKGGE